MVSNGEAGLKESCGVFGVFSPNKQVSALIFDGLYTLQHRGQEAAGMAVSDGQTITVIKDVGLVSNVFDERTLLSLEGSLGIGHTRYSTTGASNWRNAQPTYRPLGVAGFALAHNGNLTNAIQLAEQAGMLPGMVTTDSDVLAELISKKFLEHETNNDPLITAFKEVYPLAKGAFSIVAMDEKRLIGIRDPKGIRPLSLGKFKDPDFGWVLASETPALDIVNAHYLRDIEPGEMIVIDDTGPTSYRLFEQSEIDPKLCIFEFVYFARPDAKLYSVEVHDARRRMGQLLARTAPVDADMVMGVPESGVPAAEGYAFESGIPYGQGLVKNRYIGRTFIDPAPDARERAVRRKLNPLKENIKDKRLIVVDDSFVRGTTSKTLVAILREAGAKEVHLRFSSPAFKWPCFYGIDVPSREELMASSVEPDKLADILGADSVAFLSLDDLVKAIGIDENKFCKACLTGNYPVAVD